MWSEIIVFIDTNHVRLLSGEIKKEYDRIRTIYTKLNKWLNNRRPDIG